MIRYRIEFEDLMERRRTLTEMIFNSIVMLFVCALAALLLVQIPAAIDAEIKLSAVPSTFISPEKKTELAHQLIVADYVQLRERFGK